MNQNWSNPALNQNTVSASDLLLCLKPVTNGVGGIKEYQPYNILISDFAPVIASLGLLTLLPNLPTTAPEGGGLWMDNGSLAYSPVTGTVSGAPLTVDAMAASLRNLMEALPLMGASATLAGFQKNDGVIQDTEKSS
ncbi:hypothetical protein [Gluconobacter roseus]|uniref:hypothetical protein n=1 Tax=Gluconobacter roseus TaxID=586239 RepID=UPI0038D193D7